MRHWHGTELEGVEVGTDDACGLASTIVCLDMIIIIVIMRMDRTPAVCIVNLASRGTAVNCRTDLVHDWPRSLAMDTNDGGGKIDGEERNNLEDMT